MFAPSGADFCVRADPTVSAMRRVATPAGACGVIGFAVATVNATLTFINIFGGGESGEDSGQCGVRQG